MRATTSLVKMKLGSSLTRWRPLVLFWVSALMVVAVGGAILQFMGPPARPPAPLKVASQEPALGSTPQRSIAPPRPIAAEPKPSVTVLPPSRAAEPAPVPGRPAPNPKPLVAAAPGNSGPDSLDPTSGQTNGQTNGQTSGTARNSPFAVFHFAGSDNVREVAQQIAAQAGVAPDQVRTEAVTDVPQRAVIRFYSEADHALARRVGRDLAQLGYTWKIENRTARASPSGQQSLEVWLPRRPGRD